MRVLGSTTPTSYSLPSDSLIHLTAAGTRGAERRVAHTTSHSGVLLLNAVLTLSVDKIKSAGNHVAPQRNSCGPPNGTRLNYGAGPTSSLTNNSGRPTPPSRPPPYRPHHTAASGVFTLSSGRDSTLLPQAAEIWV
ncbi:hypothetical protein E2C01_061748 [Portunus trituberculatus]|uniref:Uncharacterized protein n=1 Tax=Portunus trituberculatus TaxID=210409 RepID=A0A5B7H8Z8_PORTR|nr:hypothetical protein [Portunus trituberculatus]